MIDISFFHPKVFVSLLANMVGRVGRHSHDFWLYDTIEKYTIIMKNEYHSTSSEGAQNFDDDKKNSIKAEMIIRMNFCNVHCDGVTSAAVDNP